MRLSSITFHILIPLNATMTTLLPIIQRKRLRHKKVSDRPKAHYNGTCCHELGNLNTMRVIGTQGDRDQVETLNHQRQVSVVIVMNSRVKAALRSI